MPHGRSAVDLAICGGLVCDGTGSAPFPGDVLIRDGRIEAIVPPRAPGHIAAAEVRDATDMIVAPGFIDIHTHSDVSLLADGRGESKVRQGVTTEVTGNCGFSAFPFTESRRSDHVNLLAGLGDDPLTPWWTDLDGYAAVVEDTGTALNVAPLVGHGQLRIAASGMDKKITPDAVEEMRRLLEQQLEQGAFGLSTGLTYVPSSYAQAAELQALCSVLASHDAVYATHARGSGPAAVAEAAALGRSSGARVQFSHVAINHPDHWGQSQRLLDIFDEARAAGVDIACDVYPYDASASALTQYLPAWVQEDGVEVMAGRLSDDAVMKQAERDLARGWGPEGDAVPWHWDRVVLSRTDGLAGVPDGTSIEQAAAHAGITPARLVLELCRDGGNRVQVVLFYRTESDMRAFLRYPHCVIGSDGSALPYELAGRHPHPRAYGAHARVLGRYTRELADLDLSTAVHKMTGAVAERLAVADRGLLRPGCAADVVVFDPVRVADNASFLHPCRAPSGIEYVAVNGQLVVDGGVQTRARPGRVLRSR